MPPSPLSPRSFRPVWSYSLSARCRGLALAREKGSILAWDETHWLYLLNRIGERQSQRHFDGVLTTACCSDDGSAYVAAGNRCDVWWLAPDLTTRWQGNLPYPILATALDSYGQYLALADANGTLHLFNRLGQSLFQISIPRPLHHLTFATSTPHCYGSADFGLVACFDLKGQWIWRDGLVAHVGSIAVNGAGDHLVLGCYSEGLVRYGHSGRKLEPFSPAEPCRLVAQSFDGELVLAAGQSSRLLLLDRAGQTLAAHLFETALTAVTLAALGDFAVIASTDGLLVGLKVPEIVVT